MIFRRILKIPFQLSFVAFSTAAKFFFGVKVAARHSLLTDAFTPFISDIDMSFFVSGTDQEIKILKFYKVCKFLFPYYGEAVCYSPEKLNFLRVHPLNIYEIERDPALRNILGLDPAQSAYGSKAHAAAYLLWSALRDLKNLKQRPWIRKVKWRRHFRQINLESDFDQDRLLSSILETICSLSADTDKTVRIKLAFILDYIFKNGSLKNLPTARQAESFVWAYFPAFLLYSDAQAPVIEPHLQALLFANLQYELLSVIRNPVTAGDASESIQRLLDLLEKIKARNLSEQIDDQIRIFRLAAGLFRNGHG